MHSIITRPLLLCLGVYLALPFDVSANEINKRHEDKVPDCNAHYQDAKSQLLNESERLEQLYALYRWLEAKVRHLTYEKLWQARQFSMDPLSKEKREEGNEEEDRLLRILKDLDKQSSQASNGIWQGLKKISEHENHFLPCCEEKHFQECIQEALQPVFDQVESGMPLFDRIFEKEREYRREIDLTVASRTGLYPEDTLEDPVKHSDYFVRYEMERRSPRFQEDQEVMRFFEVTRKMLTQDFAGDECCYACGKTDWEAKTESLFRDL